MMSPYQPPKCQLLLAVAVMRFALTPQITRLGRLIEFAALNQRTVERATLGHFHAGYIVVESLKILFGLILLSSLLRRHSTRPEPNPKEARWVRAD